MAAIRRSEFDDNLAPRPGRRGQLAMQRERAEPVIRAEAEAQVDVKVAAAANPADHAETDTLGLEI